MQDPAGVRAMIARRQSILEIAEIPDYPGVSTICRWKGADIARMMGEQVLQDKRPVQ